MVITSTKYYCDNCNKEIDSEEHRLGAKVGLIIELDNPKPGISGERSATYMKLCYDCSSEIGAMSNEEYINYLDSQSELNGLLERSKKKILSLFSKKQR